MDPNSGRLQMMDEADARSRGLVPVRRNLTVKEQAEMQIRLYSPCACGSGKKFKFCCKTTASEPQSAAEGEWELERWQELGPLALNISDPTLRGVVVTFLNRFGYMRP